MDSLRSKSTKYASAVAAANSRFRFGRNWRRFLAVLNDERVQAADQSLRSLLGLETLGGSTFLDIGSGSGLFSLSAMRMGAARVHSFDYDIDSVECARELRSRYFPNSAAWTIEQGSVLDGRYMRSLGAWDVVYSWGVLHHTGNMYEAFANVVPAVKDGGRLAIAIYNDQGWQSKAWWWLKRLYNGHALARVAILGAFIPYSIAGGFVADIMRRRNPLTRYRSHVRGMSHIYDWVDWLGGFPFEVASSSAIGSYFDARGFLLRRVNSCGRKHGCNEFLLEKCASPF